MLKSTGPAVDAPTALLARCLAGRWREPGSVEEPICADLDDCTRVEVVDAARGAGVAPLLYDAMRQRCAGDREEARSLRNAYTLTSIENRLRFRELAALLEELNDVGIPAIVLKGAALASAVYGDVGLRPMVDLDILVPEARVQDALDVLAEFNYVPTLQYWPRGAVLEFANEITLVSSSPPKTMLELHWHLFDSPHHQRVVDMEWFWQTAIPTQISGQETLMLGPSGLLVHLCGHLDLKHLQEAGGRQNPELHLLWLHDIAEVLVRCGDEVDWPLILHKMREYDLVLSVREVIRAVSSLWNVPIADDIRSQIDTMQPSPAEGWYYARRTAQQRVTAQRFAGNVAGAGGWAARLRYVAMTLFPRPSYMRARYEVRHPLLTPFSYVQRLYVGLASLWQR